jgi:hypothetical protein
MNIYDKIFRECIAGCGIDHYSMVTLCSTLGFETADPNTRTLTVFRYNHLEDD